MDTYRYPDASKTRIEMFIKRISYYFPRRFHDFLYTSEVFYSLKKIQCFSKLAEENDEFFTRKLRLKFFMATSLLMIPFVFSSVVFMFNTLRDQMMDEFFELLVGVENLVICLGLQTIYLILGDRFVALVKRINSKKFGIPQVLVQENILCNRLVFFSYTFDALIIILEAVYSFITKDHCSERRRTGDNRYTCGLVAAGWFPFESTSIGANIIIAIYVTGVLTIIVPYCFAVAIANMGIIGFLTSRIEDLKNQIDQSCDQGKDAVEKKLKYFVKYYHEISGCSKDMNESVGYCGIIEFSLVTLLIALLEYNLIKTQDVYYLFVLIIVLAAQAYASLSGQAFEDMHESLIQSVRNIPWFELSPRLHSNYRLFLANVEVPLHCKAQPFFYMNSQFLFRNLQGSYSLLGFFMSFRE